MSNASHNPKSIELEQAKAQCKFLKRAYKEARSRYEQTGENVDLTIVFQRGHQLMEAREKKSRLKKSVNSSKTSESSSYSTADQTALSSIMYGVPNFFPSVAVSARLFSRAVVILVGIVIAFGLCVTIGW